MDASLNRSCTILPTFRMNFIWVIAMTFPTSQNFSEWFDSVHFSNALGQVSELIHLLRPDHAGSIVEPSFRSNRLRSLPPGKRPSTMAIAIPESRAQDRPATPNDVQWGNHISSFLMMRNAMATRIPVVH